MALRGYSIHARLVDENGPKLTADDEMDDKAAHSLDPFLSGLSRSNVKPPNFVPAFCTYDEYGLRIRAPGETGAVHISAPGESTTPREDVSGWYKDLTRTNETAILGSRTPKVTQVLTKEPPPSTSAPHTAQNISRKRKRGWFDPSIASIPLASASNPPTPVPTMADIITRASSPSQCGSQSIPRNFSVIPPSNKGFSILSKSLGWQEGEGLGRSTRRRHTEWPAVGQNKVSSASSATEVQYSGQQSEESKEESEGEEENSSGEEEDIPVQLRDTHQDSNDTGYLGDSHTTPSQSNPSPLTDLAPRIAPIPVALKQDRRGIGASKTRMILTSNTLARFASGSERRRLSEGAIRHNETKARHRERREKFGRGRNSYARMEKQEAKIRDRMLEYMNT